MAVAGLENVSTTWRGNPTMSNIAIEAAADALLNKARMQGYGDLTDYDAEVLTRAAMPFLLADAWDQWMEPFRAYGFTNENPYREATL